MAKRWTIQQVAQYQKQKAQQRKRENIALVGASVMAAVAGVWSYLKRKKTA